MGCNSAYFKLGDQLLQSPPHLLLCNTTQRECQGTVLPHRTTALLSARLGAGSTLRRGDTGQPPVQCQQQQGCPLAGMKELAAGTHGMLPCPQEPALLARHWGHSAWLCHLPQWNTSPSAGQREVTLSQEAALPKEGFIPQQSSQNTS